MKNVLGIIASPRRLGNSEIFVKELSLNIPAAHQLNIIRLNDFDIRPCRACYKCLMGESGCAQDDDLGAIIEAMAAADAYVIAAPAYFLSANSSLKRLHDRSLAMYSRSEEIWNKPSAAAAIAGIEGKDGYTLLGIKSFLKSMISDIRAAEVFYSAFPGEIASDKDKLNKIKYMARKLFDTGIDGEGLCPLCGGDTFRFLPHSRVQCALCSNIGTYSVAGGQIKFDINKDSHELFLSSDVAEEHKQWLRDMKARFFDELPGLKIIRDKYRNIGQWIKPLSKE
jgi:multimeric flavodoxin WrbA